MRTKKHYEKMLSENPNTTIGFTLAADMVFAAVNGQCDVSDHIEQSWRDIARRLKKKYGENLSVDEVRAEMIKRPAAATLGSIKSDRKAASSRENGKMGGRPKSRYIEIDTKGRFCLLATSPKKEDGVVNYRKYGLLAKFDGFSPAMRPVWADARMCFLYDDETPTASQISTAWGLVADVLKYSHDQEYQELTALLK